ncbi:MAG: tetratricopeptide repeat protein, partial [Deltaproteobacteria bacterium]
MRVLWIVALVLSFAGSVTAQDRTQTLADIRAELTKLAADMLALKAELASSGNQGGTISGSVLDRVSSMETEVARLTARTEELDIRINRVVADGTNRIGDLQFRLTELEGGDPMKIPATPTLGGGGDTTTTTPLPIQPPAGGVQLAVGEQADFESAKAKIDAGDLQGGADGLLAFSQNYPGSPLGPDASMLRAETMTKLGQPKEAARAYLEAFTANPTGVKAPGALLKLGLSLDAIGQRPDACLMLREVGTRFPGAPEVTQAQSAMA